MTDRRDQQAPIPPDDGSIPEAGPDAEPRFDEPIHDAPPVVDAPGRNTEF